MKKHTKEESKSNDRNNIAGNRASGLCFSICRRVRFVRSHANPFVDPSKFYGIFIFVSATRFIRESNTFLAAICLNIELTSSHKLSNTDNHHGTIFDPYRTYVFFVLSKL